MKRDRNGVDPFDKRNSLGSSVDIKGSASMQSSFCEKKVS